MDGKKCALGSKASTQNVSASLTVASKRIGGHGRVARYCVANRDRRNSLHRTTKPSPQKIKPPTGILFSLLRQYQDSQDFRGLADSTRRSYVPLIGRIERDFGDFPLSALSDPRTRGVFMAWRDKIAVASGRRQADYAWTVLARVLSWSCNRGLISTNPCERGGRLYRSGRSDSIWSEDDEATFLRLAPSHLHLPLLLALWTGQRQGDLLRLPWSAYDGKRIRLRQGKGGARVTVPVGAPLKVALDAAPKRSTIILTNRDGAPWTSDGFRASWGKACKRVGVVGLTFHDLRGTAVHGWRSQAAPKLRLRLSPGTHCAMSDRSLMCIICIATRRWPRARLGS